MLEGGRLFLSFKSVTTQPRKENCKLTTNGLPIKPSDGGLVLCEYCIRIKNRSKNFKSDYALQYHKTHDHKDDVNIWGNLYGD